LIVDQLVTMWIIICLIHTPYNNCSQNERHSEKNKIRNREKKNTKNRQKNKTMKKYKLT